MYAGSHNQCGQGGEYFFIMPPYQPALDLNFKAVANPVKSALLFCCKGFAGHRVIHIFGDFSLVGDEHHKHGLLRM